MACEECHLAKVKCDKKSPCSRCARLGLNCLPHVSLQGRGLKRRRTGPFSKLVLENSVIRNTSQLSTSGPLHFGLNHLLRQWIALSFARRSFRLLELAAKLSNKLGIHMDQIISGKDLPASWVSHMKNPALTLGDSIASPSEDQEVGGPALEEWEIPLGVWKAMCCTTQAGSDECVNVENVASRWIFVRGNSEGKTRFFVSKAFARDIAPVSIIQKTWKENEKEVLSIWSRDPNHSRSMGPFLFQLLSQYNSPDAHPSPVRSTKGENITLANGEEITAQTVSQYRIIDLDHSFLVIEYLLPQRSAGPKIEPIPVFGQTDVQEKNELFLGELPDFAVAEQETENWLGDLLDSLS